MKKEDDLARLLGGAVQKLRALMSRKKRLLATYRTRLEQEKVSELRSTIAQHPPHES